MENIVKNNEMVLGLKDLFKMGKSSLSFDKWYGILKSNKQPEKEIASLINVAKENTYNENKIFKAVNAIYDEDAEAVKIYKLLDGVCKNPFTHVLTKKLVEFTDFTSFLVYTAIECEEDMGFLLADEYKQGKFDMCNYAVGEEVWYVLEKLICMDYKTMEKEFKSVKWEDNENTAIVSFKNNPKEYAILRL
ncbi:hypothetical protein FDG50_00460 [Clostridium botulinum]|uniref:hypothetical protein n=1 Tax=Clostridium botulinum TaxID=1491 RepID=UPI001400CFB4|nr:hypothetical protein [Clostridium botulinum]MBY6836001.1 hypothetical protein [Clostridium botulinum]NFG65784.1 hypothetical protein [Clostridium botulinum]NFQ22620.1 hypothetical protein [Clostridium botulinum]